MDVLHLIKRAQIKIKRRALVTRTLAQTQTVGVLSAARLFFYVWMPLGSRRRASPQIAVSKFGREAVFYPKDYYDLEVLRHILEEDDYSIELPVEPKIIFDLGAHVGASALYFALKYPNTRIYCFEADPGNFKQLEKNAAQFDNVYPINNAVCGTDRMVRLYVHPKSVSHSIVERASDQSYVDVPGKSLDSLMGELGLDRLDLIKFNIEGMEFEVLKNFEKRNEVAGYIGHLHFDLIDASREEWLQLFSGYKIEMEPTKPERFKFIAKHPDIATV